MDDEGLLKIIYKSNNQESQNTMATLGNKQRINKKTNQQPIIVYKKFRYIDPEFANDKGDVKRLSDVYKDLKKTF